MIEYINVGDRESIVKFPCRIGDHFYRPDYINTLGRYKIIEYRVSGFTVDEYSIWINLTAIDYSVSSFTVYANDIGNEIFYTAEEAKKKIEEL